MKPTLFDLEQAGWIAPADAALARTLARLAGVAPADDAALAVALVSQQVRAGHVCLALDAPPSIEELAGDAGGDEVRGDWRWPEPGAWRDALEATALVGPHPGEGESVSPRRPLVLDVEGRLYLTRYFEHEQRLAGELIARTGEVEGVDADVLARGLDRIFGAARGDERDAQRHAAETAVRQRLCVITGGPGTGKTSTVAAVLALAVEQALAAGAPAPRILLIAPTGKAAAALTEGLERALGGLDCDDAVREAIPAEASTVHRALGVLGGVGARFRHGADTPWPADLVVLDEASMVDLSLMRRLVDAVPETARLVMMGDADQLASVEAGAVLGDVCGAGLEDVADGAIESGIVRLLVSYRFAADSGVGGLARAIHAGDAAAAIDVLEDPARPDVSWIDDAGDVWPDAVERALADGYASFRAARDLDAALGVLGEFRVLCPHRAGPRGVEAFNRVLGAQVERDASGFVAEPILIERNDYAAELFNGDMGVRATASERLAGQGARFVGREGRPRSLSELRLPPHAPCWAMSVHKSQGSEFDAVLVALPERSSPLLTREMLYTAVTRARQRVVVWGGRAQLVECIERRVQRRSGLRDALWSPRA